MVVQCCARAHEQQGLRECFGSFGPPVSTLRILQLQALEFLASLVCCARQFHLASCTMLRCASRAAMLMRVFAVVCAFLPVVNTW